ncbi:polysulfide reductase NrfD [Ornithinimicrobium humiphilum]|uniref:Formate-dependent nitrite reductase membrane component NrfD n=1 Tax=Ornithinimicrobium humiphilum TaxID=125288 RepID=A0A543K6Q0_9MICO|nr:NrfD/PsrC family molybdoenzyme membrane anchor subunit [Ornithinimicrobium humiphilum]TQM90756.1 formate-dependent nitrite reductase membrane component NrfD [Ornithinimicrobium humiphilum]
MTTSRFDSYRPPEDGPRRRRRTSVRDAVTGAARDVVQGGRSWLDRDGGGRREAPAVPDAEFVDYYGQPVIKPVPWKHEIPAYLFLGGVAAGSGLIAAGAAATGRPGLRRSSRLTAMTAVALSGATLVADLGRPERFLNMLRTVKLTSPMSVGTWILSGYAAFAGAATAAEVSRMVPLPATGPLAVARTALGVVEAPATVGQALFAPPLAAYTAVLLSDTVTPVWFESRRQLPFVFVASAAMASAGVQLALGPGRTGPVQRLAVLGAATDLVATHRLEQHLEGLELREPLETGPAGRKLRLAKALTVAGGLGALGARRSRALAVASGVALAAASALTRFGIVEAGLESARDPRYTVGPQRRRLEERRARGAVHDSITTVG